MARYRTFWPALRVWTYNVTQARHGSYEVTRPIESGLEDDGGARIEDDSDAALDLGTEHEVQAEGDGYGQRHADASGSTPHISKRKHRRKKHGKHKHLPRHASPSSPSRSNGRFSLLGYSQWICDLEGANQRSMDDEASGKKSKGLQFFLEYATYQPETLWAELLGDVQASRYVLTREVLEGTSRSEAAQHVPVPKHLLQAELERLHSEPPRWFDNSGSAPTRTDAPTSSTQDSSSVNPAGKGRRKLHVPKRLKHLTDWDLPALTIPDLLELGRRLANDKKLWKRYRRRIYASSGALD